MCREKIPNVILLPPRSVLKRLDWLDWLGRSLYIKGCHQSNPVERLDAQKES